MIFFRGFVIFTETWIHTYSPNHSLWASIPMSSTFPTLKPNYLIMLASIHINDTLWIWILKEAWEKDCFLILPIPLGSWSTIKALSKCHGPLVRTLFLSSSRENLNMKMLLLRLSILNSLTVRQAWCRAILSSSRLTPLARRIFPIKHPAIALDHFSFIWPPKIIWSASSPSRVIALHFCISSSVSISCYKSTHFSSFTRLSLALKVLPISNFSCVLASPCLIIIDT